jgi:uncharacterized protein (TIGR02246 family)
LEGLFHPSSHAAQSEQTLAEGRIMHPRSLIPMLAVVASCSASATPPRDTRAADEAAIEAAMKDYTAAILANDAAKVASWWTEDALYIDRAAPAVHGRAGLESLVKGELGAMSVTAASVEKDDLAVSGDLAYFIGRYHEVLQPRQGAALEDGGRFVFIWKRQSDGTWKIARSVGTDLAKAAGAAPAAQKDSSKKSG